MSIPAATALHAFSRRPAPSAAPAANAGRLGLGVSTAAILAFALFWLPSPLSTSDFSIAFILPFALAGWALLRARSGPTIAMALHGVRGSGLWIEMLFVGVALLLAWSSMIVSPEPQRAFRVILPMAFGICALILLTGMAPLSARRLTYAMIISGVAVTAAGLLMASVGGLRHVVVSSYRFQGFFENANQPALAIIAFWPLVVALFLNARKATIKALCLLAGLVLAAALLLTGTKTGLAIGFVSGCIVYLYHSTRAGRLDRTILSLVITLSLIAAAVPMSLWALSWANPTAYDKVNDIITGGVQAYPSIKSRNVIWEESIRLGLSNPLLGAGAGSKVLGRSHAHNMIIDYFRGMGVFGIFVAVGLLVCTAARCISFLASTVARGRNCREMDTIVLAFYLGALGYLIGNQVSDSFSPSTAFAYWMVYICAYLSSMDCSARFRSPRLMLASSWRPRASSQSSAIIQCAAKTRNRSRRFHSANTATI